MLGRVGLRWVYGRHPIDQERETLGAVAWLPAKAPSKQHRSTSAAGNRGVSAEAPHFPDQASAMQLQAHHAIAVGACLS